MTKITIKPSRQVVIKFVLLLALLAGYFGYLVYEFDLITGGLSALLTWSFFVLCTPVADAGFLLDFPLRLLFGIRMVISEIAVWAVAILINILSLTYAASYYDTTFLTKVLYQIILNPYPYWAVIILSGIGTFLSIRFGDELMDVLHHRDRDFFHSHHFKHELVLFAFFLAALYGYYELIVSLDIAFE
ncbi:MAG: hypothetical protein COB93_03085 [Sneathiella sp.]|nr:MAG: hypothetical protein COB93_03085 [Sneathiella sp.]